MRVSFKKNGFTLLELMITMAVFAILVAAAFPSYRIYNANNKSTALATAVATSLRLAKSEAIQRNVNVVVCPMKSASTPSCGATSDWGAGWLVVNTSNNTNLQVYAANNPGAVTFQPGSGYTGTTITFTPIGFTQPAVASVLVQPAAATHGYTISISSGGSITTQLTSF